MSVTVQVQVSQEGDRDLLLIGANTRVRERIFSGAAFVEGAERSGVRKLCFKVDD